MSILIDDLRVVARTCQAAATSFSDEEVTEGLAVTDELRAIFLARLASSAANAPVDLTAATLLLLPPELLSVILATLDIRSLARLAATCRPLWLDALTPASAPLGVVEVELRRRADARGLEVGSSLPEGSTSWVACLLKRDRRDAQRRQAPLAVGRGLSMFVDKFGRLLTCGCSTLGHAVDPDADPNFLLEIGLPTPVPSMQDRRIVGVATGGMYGDQHCLALSVEGEVYSWGHGANGALGRADGGERALPSRIESLSRIESIAAGPDSKSAAVDEVGRLFTWGLAMYRHEETFVETMPNGLGYAVDARATFQPTPKRVEALSRDRVVGVALSYGATLAVTDAGAVFTCGCSDQGALGHGSLEAEVLPRQIEALAQTGRRFVAVAAGNDHALALTEEGELYGWGAGDANGHGREERTPRRVAALIGERVKLIAAQDDASCAVTEKGELFTWSCDGTFYNLGHGVSTPRVKG